MKLIRITTVPISLNTLLKGQMKYMKENGYNVLLCSADGPEINDIINNEGCEFHIIPLTRKITPLKDIYAIFKLIQVIRKFKPDIVHTHTPKAGFVGMVASKIAGVKIRMHTVAGLPLMESRGIKRRILELVEKITYKLATKVYPNSFGLSEFIITNKLCNSDKIKIIGSGSSNGIDISYFNPKTYSESSKDQMRKLLGISEKNIVFTFVGRIVGDKGVNELVYSFLDLLNDFDDINLLLVGEFEGNLDPLSPEIIDIIKTNSKIISVGYQKDVRPYFSISDIFVFPSYREGFPNVVMQAGAMELPCIVSNINGCNEIIKDGVNGLIVPAKDLNELKNAMIKLKEDIELRGNLKKNSRSMITTRFEQNQIWKKILEEYINLGNNV